MPTITECGQKSRDLWRERRTGQLEVDMTLPLLESLRSHGLVYLKSA